MIDFIWHSVWAQLSLAGILVVGLLAAAWFSPVFKRWFIGAAGLVLAAASIYAKGAADAARRAKERQDKAEREAIESGKRDRERADSDAAGGVRDGYDRDK